MAWDDDDKTEAPTARRMEEAREQGQVPRSLDLTAAIVLLSGLLLLNFYSTDMYRYLLELTRTLGEATDVSSDSLAQAVGRAGNAALLMIAPFMLLIFLITLAGGLTQTGGSISAKRLRPNLGALNPASALKRLFSTDSLTRAVLGLLKLTLVGAVAYHSLVGRIQPVIGATTVAASGILHMAATIVYDLALRLALVLLVLGLIDYLYQRWKLMQKLKMTKQQVKDELKRMEGDPLLKQRRRQIQMKLALQRLRKDVPAADVVVTNPTEFAVALKYDQETMAAPRVVAKGLDFLAARIREIAAEHGVPVVQRPALARGLYAAVEIGGEVPPKFYRALAEVLAYVYQISRRARKAHSLAAV